MKNQNLIYALKIAFNLFMLAAPTLISYTAEELVYRFIGEGLGVYQIQFFTTMGGAVVGAYWALILYKLKS